MQGPPALKPDDLVYAATHRCPCGAGLAYANGAKHPSGRPITGYWDCSAILLGTADPASRTVHTAQLPFAFYEIKGENQPSAQGATTRP